MYLLTDFKKEIIISTRRNVFIVGIAGEPRMILCQGLFKQIILKNMTNENIIYSVSFEGSIKFVYV